MSLKESIFEYAAREWFGELSHTAGRGPQMVPGELAAERNGLGDVVLIEPSREANRRLNTVSVEDARTAY